MKLSRSLRDASGQLASGTRSEKQSSRTVQKRQRLATTPQADRSLPQGTPQAKDVFGATTSKTIAPTVALPHEIVPYTDEDVVIGPNQNGVRAPSAPMESRIIRSRTGSHVIRIDEKGSPMPIIFSPRGDDHDRTLVDAQTHSVIDDALSACSSSRHSDSSSSLTCVDAGEVGERCAGFNKVHELRHLLHSPQSDLLDCLSRITTTTVRHLLHEEIAIADVIEDYDAVGTEIIESLAQRQRDDHNRMMTQLDNEKSRFIKRFETTSEDIERLTREIRSSRSISVEERWKARRNRLLQKLDHSLAGLA
ncbi:MAG: hypothetical protein M1833_006476 [Piccolia ochrophora]|nr:MAG: hypothetical protein M1833_006476 [Piccolia ochrophora]